MFLKIGVPKMLETEPVTTILKEQLPLAATLYCVLNQNL